MIKIRKSFSKKEVFHAWVNQSGLSYYKSNKSYKSITGYNNVLFAGDRINTFKNDKTDEEIDKYIKNSYNPVIAIIDRDKKETIVHKDNNCYNLKKVHYIDTIKCILVMIGLMIIIFYLIKKTF